MRFGNVALQLAAGDRPFQRSLPWRMIARGLYLTLALALVISTVSLLAGRFAGYQYITVRGESMEPTISAGSLLLASQPAPEDILVGDIIAFPGTKEGVPFIVHRVMMLKEYDERIVALTMGDNNPEPDPRPLSLERSVIRVDLIVPYLGWFLNPEIGWYLLGACTLLSVRIAYRWKAQRVTRIRANVPQYMRLNDVAVVEQQHYPKKWPCG